MVLTIFYTSIGGIKAVVWNDSFQSVVMMVGIVAVLIKGCLVVGGIGPVWDLNEQFGRLNFFEFTPRVILKLIATLILH